MLYQKSNEIPVDIFEMVGKTRVVVELIDVSEKDIRIDLLGNTLVIFANREHRRYNKEIRLPQVYENMVTKLYYNGILDITLT